MKVGHGVFQLFLFLTILVWSCSETLYCHAQRLDPLEVETLKQIGSKLGKQWNFNVDPCSGASGWVDPTTDEDFVRAANVTCGNCNATYCHVISVLLKRQNLTGPLPVEFANLKSLQFLDLTQNYLGGTIPVEWTSLPLSTLSLLGNNISGRIPEEIGNITTLNILVLEDNLFQGPIPSSLGKLIHLEQLLLSANNLIGELPESLGKLKNLTYFRIDGNPISGKIPSFIANWTKIQYLEMQGTSLEGPFPPSFSTLENLSELRVTDWKGGDGKFPPLENMKGMTRLVLRNLSISGELPEYIGAMTNLKFLDLSFNFLTGQIPNNYSSLQSHIDFIYLTNNNLSGAIPDWILTTRKQHVDVSYNSFNGSNAPPDCLRGSNLNVVSSYSSSNNKRLASCLRRNNPCPGKAINYNLFINCGGPSLTIGDDEYQGDTDTEGPSYYNSYNDEWAYSSTGSFVHNDNEPFLAKNVSVLTMADAELYTTARLSPLSLKYYGLCLQNGNYTVNLHFAEIMFTDAGTYFSVGRRFFDASIQGKKVLRDFNIAEEANGTGRAIIKSFTANVSDHTLEIHFQWAGKGTNAVPEINVYGPLVSAISVTPNFEPVIEGNNTKEKVSTGAILGIVAAGCVLIVLISIFIWFCLRRKYAANNELQGVELQTGYFTLRQIKAATGNFDAANKLGEGGFGPVYKGVLPDGSAIAVKQLSAKSRQGNREFINEIGMISALQHPNLVRLFGCCIEGNQLLLIYEYMENNNLGNALFGRERERLNLDWKTRCRICLDIARGLAYLHEESRLKIVHRDIKAANVLLDKDLNAKISDFGLARLCEEDGDKTHISTRIAGTVGYMAPEYAMRGYLTDKADVYSFGVVMLEIICGLSNTHTYRTKEDFIYLLDWALILQGQGELLDIVDKNLGENYPKEEALQMLNLALTCTNSSPSLRPTMSTVVSILDGKSTLPISSMNPLASSSNAPRFQLFDKCFDDSQSADASIDAPWYSSASQQSSQDENTRQTSKLLSDFSNSSFDVETQRRYLKRNSTATA
ncbi:Non-specific serine/threonine protein kinase protein [Dioscorea alata]|uniref:Non-specific serine/threonine protein kinase protein n=1 Tax=Dioscorea alata TaxID=55571 RepID=A0ACB7TSG6_DIOAL|nr:Non-specific serine/threonine protein kinase protein [Dioscorea alata]